MEKDKVYNRKKIIIFFTIIIIITILASIIITRNYIINSEQEQALSKIECAFAKVMASTEAIILIGPHIEVSECKASHKNQTLNIWMDITSQQASDICYKLSVRQSEKGWKIKVYSPFSGDHPLATCTS